MTVEPPVSHPERKWQLLAGVTVLIATLFVVTYSMTAQSQLSILERKEPEIVNSTYADANQTRAELLEIINNQRARVFSSYALEYYYCKDHLGAENVHYAQRSNFKMDNGVMSELVTCKHVNGSSITYRYTFNHLTGEYDEYVLFSPGST